METQPTSAPDTNGGETAVFGMKPNTYCMMLHLSQLFNFWVPPCGFVLPIVLWVIGKDKCPQIDQHGKIVLNWLISLFIYTTVGIVAIAGFIFSSILIAKGTGMPVGLGLPLYVLFFILLLIPAIIFPIIGALKANEGTAWNYPLSIRSVLKF